MKKLFFCSILTAFVCITAAQAGENCCDKTKTACASKSSCCAEKPVAKKADISVKGATLLVRR
jgi:hypothetical protein